MEKLVIVVLVAAMNSGGLSVARIRQEYGDVGMLGEVRYWLFYVVLVLLAALAYHRSTAGSIGRWRIRGRWMWLWVGSVALLHGYLIMTSFWSSELHQTQQHVLDLLLLLGLLITSALVFARSPARDISWLLTSQFWISIAFLAGAVLGPWSNDEGLKAFWGGAIGFARIVGAGAIAALHLWTRTGRVSWLIPYPALVLAALLSGSRAASVALMLSSVGFFATVLVIRPELRRGLRAGTAVLVIGAFALAWSAVPTARMGLPGFWLSIQQLVPSDPAWTNVYLGDREVLFQEAWSRFLQQPIFGSGLGSFDLQVARETYRYPHNLVLNAAVDGGVVALVFLTLSFVMLLPRWYQPLGLEQVAALALGGFHLIPSMFSGTYYDARLMWIFFLLYLTPVEAVPFPRRRKVVAGAGLAHGVNR